MKRSRAVALSTSLAVLLVGRVALAADAATPLVGDPPDLQKLVGARVDVQQTSGKRLGDMEVTKIVPGESPGSIRAMTVKPADSPRVQTFNASTIDEIVVAGVPLDVTYDKVTRELAYNPEKRKARLDREAKIHERMAARRERFWEDIPDEDQAKYVEELKEFLEEGSQTIGVPMQLLETRYFLFYTDMPINSVGIYVQYLDSMYEQLTKAFNFPEGKNIWRGKCPVVAFALEETFLRWEAEVMMSGAIGGVQGLCHSSSDGRVVITCFKGDSVEFFATILVHETAHGFIHRYKSTVHIPPWINEGIADWVAGTVVRSDTEVRRRQAEAVQRIRQLGTLGGRFFDDDANFERVEYGTASSLVELLLRIDAKKYRTLIDGVKEGLRSEEALQEAYGMNFAQLAQRYGALAGVPNLTP